MHGGVTGKAREGLPMSIGENQVGTSQDGRLGAYRVRLGASGQVDPYRHWCALEASDKRKGCGVALHMLFI